MLARTVLSCVLAVAVSACGGGSTPHDTVDALVADPAKLKDVMQRCHDDHAAVGDAECNVASEAFRRRFAGSGAGQSKP
jgi:hypothetical protein